jgi:hypothetical protein
MELSSHYQEEIEFSKRKCTCDICYDRGYYFVFNAYDPKKENTMACTCMLGQMYMDNKLKALNSNPD